MAVEFLKRKISFFMRNLSEIIFTINRLNSGFKNVHNSFMWTNFLFQKRRTDSVNHADSEDIKILIQFPGKSILKNSLHFWNWVGYVRMRRCFILKIAKWGVHFTLVILICESRGTYLISRQPTQFSIFGRFFIR